MCKLTKNLPIQGGCWILRIQGEGNSGEVDPVGAIYILGINRQLPSLTNTKNYNF